MKPIRWGILGCGNIAKQFAAGLAHAPGAVLAAVGSRDAAKAAAFAAAHGTGRAHGSYEALVADPNVDAVYVATPHVAHCANTLNALEHGKAVLCEKPFALNAPEARRMAAAARDRGLFLMEAMWTRFFPAMVRVRELLAAGAIGEPRMVQADFGFRTGWNPESRLLNPALGGGALLDVGIYPVSFASMVFGKAEAVTGLADLGETGVDEQSAMVLRYAGGRLAVLSCAVRTSTPHEARIWGTEGSIRIESAWWRPRAIVVSAKGTEERIDLPFEGNGYQFEAVEVAHCLEQGLTESPVIPLHETIELMEILDALRAQWGLRYPGEGQPA